MSERCGNGGVRRKMRLRAMRWSSDIRPGLAWLREMCTCVCMHLETHGTTAFKMR
jgi:hypothetical protein